MPRIEETGNRYGTLSVVGLGAKTKHGITRWICKCDCGKKTLVIGSALRSGKSRSCGNRKIHYSGSNGTSYVHGKSHTSECRSWYGMFARCYQPTNVAYHQYGGRGIVVCERWQGEKGFENFLADVGPKPSSKHSLDRRDADGNYEPGNCKWSTKKEQIQNRRKYGSITSFSDEEIKAEFCRRRLSL